MVCLRFTIRDLIQITEYNFVKFLNGVLKRKKKQALENTLIENRMSWLQ